MNMSDQNTAEIPNLAETELHQTLMAEHLARTDGVVDGKVEGPKPGTRKPRTRQAVSTRSSAAEAQVSEAPEGVEKTAPNGITLTVSSGEQTFTTTVPAAEGTPVKNGRFVFVVEHN